MNSVPFPLCPTTPFVPFQSNPSRGKGCSRVPAGRIGRESGDVKGIAGTEGRVGYRGGAEGDQAEIQIVLIRKKYLPIPPSYILSY